MNRFTRSSRLCLAAAFASVALLNDARADIVHLALTDGINNISFDILTLPGTTDTSPYSVTAHTATFQSYRTTINGVLSATRVTFYDATYGGGLVMRSALNDIILSQTGYPSATLFTGQIISPELKLGTFQLTDDGAAQFTNNFRIALTDLSTGPTNAVPEPMSLALVFPGLVALLATRRRKTHC